MTFHHKLQVANGKPNVVTTMKVRRLEWAGHVERMSEDRTVNKVLLEETRLNKKSRKTKIMLGKL